MIVNSGKWIQEINAKVEEGISITINGQEYELGIVSINYDNPYGMIDIELKGWPKR
jgi:hypothetical protein